MIELVFKESEALSLKLAKNDGELCKWNRDKVSEESFNQVNDGQSVGGNVEDVIVIPFMLDVGKINVPIESDYRKKLLLDLSLIHRIDETASMEQIWKGYLDELKKLKIYAQKGEHFRIWYSDGAYSRCGLHYACSILRDYPCKVSVIKLPEYRRYPRGIQIFRSWSELAYDEMYQFLSLEKELSRFEIQCFGMKWDELKDEDSDLRVVIDGKLISVSDDFYDILIRQEIPDDEFMVIQLIGKLVVNYQLAIDDAWYIKRIQWMIEQGELAIVKKEDRFSHYILKKN